MKNIFIVGARGYQAKYGGWETFVTNLVDHYHDKDTKIYVSELALEKEIDKVEIKKNKNLSILPIYVKIDGSAKMFIYTMKAYLSILKYIKKNNLKNCYIYVLGLKLGPLLWFYKHTRRKYNIKIFVNPDGLEHRRSKWNKVVQLCFLLSEWSMINHCDLVVCDALGIEEYILKKYKRMRDKTKYIAYGAKKIDLSNVDENTILKDYDLVKDDYCLMVGRCVPENNYEMVIKSFMDSNINKKLVVVTNLSSSNYYQELESKLNFSSDERICFIDGVYDEKKLAVIRKNAYLYIHGHSVGGTNPSLLEALSLTDLNILYDVCFNRDIGGDACLYFKESLDLEKLLNDSRKLDKKRKELGNLAHELIEKNFTWDKIVRDYKKIFK